MRTVVVIYSILAIFGLCSCATFHIDRSSDEPFTSEDEFSTWFAHYYEHPQPERIKAALIFMRNHDYLDETKNRNRDLPVVTSVFLAQLFSSHAADLSKWAGQWNDLGPSEWYIILVGLHLAHQSEATKVLNANIKRVDQDHRSRIKAMANTNWLELNPLTAEIVNYHQIYLVWAAFSATGDTRYVDRVISNIKYFGDDDDQMRQIGETALLSLASNAVQHPRVLRECVHAYEHSSDPATRILLSAMLAAISDPESDKQLDLNTPRNEIEDHA
jgi:hypothetical protein